ncbi:MAG: hypothetical protein AB8H03_06845 [Saprospiraceae bacterium]
MKNILLTIAGILFFCAAYYIGFTRTYVIYSSYPKPYYPIEIKGVGNYLHFANNASTIGASYLNQKTIKGAIVSFRSGSLEKGKIEYGCYKSSLTNGYFPFKGTAKMHAIFMFLLFAAGSWLIRLSFKKE